MFDYLDFSYKDKKFVEEQLDCIAQQNIFVFENAIKETIKQLELKHNDLCEEEFKFSEQINEIRRKEKNKNNSLIENDLIHKEMHCHFEYMRIREELKSLSEMLLIYAFKSLEINIKTLIKIAYPNINTKDFFRWETLIQFLKAKRIDISVLNSFNHILELKNLSNNIKHKNILTDDLCKIQEFKYSTEFDYPNLMNFYERIKEDIPLFLLDLSASLKKDLFEFSNERILTIAEELRSRMSDENIKVLIKQLNIK